MIDDASDKTGSHGTKVQTAPSAAPRTFTQPVGREVNRSPSADTCWTSCSSATHAVAPRRLSNSQYIHPHGRPCHAAQSHAKTQTRELTVSKLDFLLLKDIHPLGSRYDLKTINTQKIIRATYSDRRFYTILCEI